MKKDWMIRESELDDDQIKVLMATLDKSCVVKGCAGSGKSVLALIKAQRIQKERGDSYIVIVFTKALCNYMEAGRKDLGLHNRFTYHWDWVHRQQCRQADYVIVDEIQDFTDEEIKQFITAARKNYFFFGDTAQSIYGGLKTTCPVEEIGYLLPRGQKPNEWQLYRNYRLPKPVARFVQYVGVDLQPFEEDTYKSRMNDKPHVLGYANVMEQLAAIKRLIGRGLTDVAVLLPHNDMVKGIGEMMGRLGMNIDIRYTDKVDWRNSVESLNFSGNNPKVMTYHSAKGLQFETVFLPCMESFLGMEERDRKALYVAMTRTYKDLYIMYSGHLPGVFSAIPSSLYETTEEKEIEDI